MIALYLAIPMTYAAATIVAGGVARWGFPLPPAHARIGCIDGLRGYLALSVLIHHFVIWTAMTRRGTGWAAPDGNLLSQMGGGAVALFFMTTGFVFYPRVLAGWRVTNWRSVLIGRVFRLLPLVGCSILVILLIIRLRTGNHPGPRDLIGIPSWLFGWKQVPLAGYPDSGRLNAYVLWSLWYEWFFYLLLLPAAAMLADLLRGRAPSWAAPALILAAALAAQAFALPRNLQLYLPFFAVGMLAFEVTRRPRARAALSRPAASLAAALALAAGALTAPDPFGLAQVALFGVFFTCVAGGASLGGLLSTRGALVLGECSFGLYLLHGVALALLFTEGAGLVAGVPDAQLPWFLIALAPAVALTTMGTYLGVERPAIQLGRRIVARWSGAVPRRNDPQLEVAP